MASETASGSFLVRAVVGVVRERRGLHDGVLGDLGGVLEQLHVVGHLLGDSCIKLRMTHVRVSRLSEIEWPDLYHRG